MANENRLIDANALRCEIDCCSFETGYDGEKVLEIIAEAPTVKAVPVDEILRVIAGHSNYHGDNILSALICIAEGEKVNPVRPLEKVDAVEVVRCKDCKYYWKNVNTPGFDGKCTTVGDDDFCSDGERRDNETL